MKINIAASHRFHVLDLATQLQALGHDVTFYSYVPSSRCEKYGFDPKKCKSFLWLVLPFVLVQKILPAKWHVGMNWYRNRLMDWFVSKTMKPCDVFIGLGCIYDKSFKVAKEKYRAKTILEWGSKHIIEELLQFGKLDQYPKRQLKFDLNEYQTVDYISIASTHVKNSFLKHKISIEKLLVDPYGVGLDQFHPTEYTGEYDLIMVGSWCYRKGCDLIAETCKKYGYRLLHVGPVVDLNFQFLPNCVHHQPVDQKELVNYYSKAKVFVLPSRTEGLSLVQAQAIACGLPVVCSTETGGIDLRNQLSDKKWIIEMSNISVESLHECIEQALSLAEQQQKIRNYAKEDIDNLSWEAYGKRYDCNLKRIANL